MDEDRRVEKRRVKDCETDVSIKEYFDAQLASLSLATKIANDALNCRLEGMNEFRSHLKDQAGTFFTRAEHNFYAEKVDTDIRTLREYKAELQGKASQASVNITIVIAIVSMIIGIGSIIVHLVGK